MNLFQDLKRDYSHLMTSYEFYSKIHTPMTEMTGNEEFIDTEPYAKIETGNDLMSNHAIPLEIPQNESLYEAVCVIKPN